MLKRLRGLLMSMLLWSIPWALLGIGIGLAYVSGVFPPGITVLGPDIPGGLPVGLGLAGAVVGAINGLAFGAVVIAAERRHALDELRPVRFGLWAALATGATVVLLTSSAAVAAICSVFGFGTGVGILRLAQRKPTVEALDAVT